MHSPWPPFFAKVPGEHSLQSAKSSLPSTLIYLPAGHALHTLMDFAPIWSPYLPIGHFLHSVLQPGVFSYVPFSHFGIRDNPFELEQLPAGNILHLLFPVDGF